MYMYNDYLYLIFDKCKLGKLNVNNYISIHIKLNFSLQEFPEWMNWIVSRGSSFRAGDYFTIFCETVYIQENVNM